MSFCAAINCMDGRTQLPVIQYLMKRFEVQYVDMITDAGPLGILAKEPDATLAQAIEGRLSTAVSAHGVKELAIAGHWDCRGNPEPREVQLSQQREVVLRFRERFPELTVIGLWVNESGDVEEIDISA
jgi:hypothetical protein